MLRPYEQGHSGLSAWFLGHATQRVMQARAHVGGKFYRLRVTEYIYGQLRLIDHHRALSAVSEMPFDLLLRRDVEFAVDIVRDLANDAFTVQFDSPRRK